MSLAARDRMTVDEFLATTDELTPAQLIDGAVVPMNLAVARHQRVVTRLLNHFYDHLRDHPEAGELSAVAAVVVGPFDAYIPDLYWVPADRLLLDSESTFADTPPPLVVEVLSPSTRSHDRGIKLRGYERAGVEEVWLADAEADLIHVHRRSLGSDTIDEVRPVGHGDTLTTPLVPGWAIDLAELFRR